MFESVTEDAWGIGLESQICAATGAPTPQSLRSVDFGGDDAVLAALETGPGPCAAALLCTVEVDQLSPEGRLDYVKAWEEQTARAAAMAMRALVRHVGPEPVDDSPSTEQKYLDQAAAASEMRLTLGLSASAMEDRVVVARELSTRLCATYSAMQQGQVSFQQALALVEVTRPLSREDAGEVEAMALQRCVGRPLSDWRRSCRAKADRLDPEATARRHRLATTERTVRRWRELDGMATLNVTAPAPDVEAIWGALTVLSGPRESDDPRPLGARRVDALLGLCLGAVAPDPETDSNTPTRVVSRPRIPTQAHIVIDLPTLLGLADNPCELKGYGQVPAGVARDWLHHATTWRRLVTDPVEGYLLDYGPTIRFAPSRLREYVQERDGSCVFPGCRHPAHRSDLDHHPPWKADGSGGHTSASHLAAECRRDHRLKTHTGWTLRRAPEGGLSGPARPVRSG